MNLLEQGFVYWYFVTLLMIGLWGAISKKNLVKKLIGLSIFETAIILFYVSIGDKEGATIPLLTEADMAPGAVIDVANYVNPLPHVLMLTAIVVGVATLGVGLAIAQRIHAEYGTLEEDEILEQIARG